MRGWGLRARERLGRGRELERDWGEGERYRETGERERE